MKLWFRVDAATPRDPTVAEFAARLNVSVVTALGHCVAIWSAMAEHATDGSLARVSDATIEAWAMWTKRKGVLAQAFRALFTDDVGVVHGWLDRQGKLLTRMERDRQRHRRAEESSTEIPRNFHGDSTSTERNGTEQRSPAAASSARVKDSQRPTLIEALGAPLTDRLEAVLLERASDDVAREHFRTIHAIACGVEPPHLTNPQLAEVVAEYLDKAMTPTLALLRGFLRTAKERAGRPPPEAARPPAGAGVGAGSPTGRSTAPADRAARAGANALAAALAINGRAGNSTTSTATEDPTT